MSHNVDVSPLPPTGMLYSNASAPVDQHIAEHAVNASNPWQSYLAPFSPLEHTVAVGPVTFGDGRLALIAGPCSIESEHLCLTVAERVSGMCARLGIPYVFKASFDKANRTSAGSWRGLGLEEGLRVLERVRTETGVPVLTDVHESGQVATVAAVVDVVQVPAFLCRQTDLLLACGVSGRTVNVKKGQFLAPEDMQFAAGKIASTGNHAILLTERGTMHGYRDLVVDIRSLVVMRRLGYPVVYDATHSVQQMGAGAGVSAGLPEFIPALTRAAVAAGIDALFIETHPDPAAALSDGATMIPLDYLTPVLESAVAGHQSLRRVSMSGASSS